MSQKSDEPTKKAFHQDKPYAVFLSFNSEDREAVETIARYLADTAKLSPWFDHWNLIPGEDWVDGLYRGLEESATCAVFVGKSGEGPWQKQEVKAALIKQASNQNFRVIPVLLPDAPKQPELPPFLPARMWVDFRQKGIDDDDALWRLECGIRGEPPGRGRPIPQPEETPRKQEEMPEQTKAKRLSKQAPGAPVIRLQSKPLWVSKDKAQKLFLDPNILKFLSQKETPKKQPGRPEQAKKKQPPEGKPRVPVTRLRSEPLSVSKDKAQKVFRLGKDWQPLEYIKNDYEDQGKTVIDHATGLIWQKSGSDEPLTYEEAQVYVDELNRRRFAGYNDWRLPTVEELMSLLEPEKQLNDRGDKRSFLYQFDYLSQSLSLCINPIFDAKQRLCWSADERSPESAWYVGFGNRLVYCYGLNEDGYVRCVRSR